MYVIRFGNPAPVRATRDKTDKMTLTPVSVDAPVVTVFTCYADGLQSLLAETVDMWRHHASENPVWVQCDDEGVEALLASHFGCERGERKATKKGARR